MSFFLDWFMFFGLGALVFGVTSWIRTLWKKWSGTHTAALMAGLIIFLAGWSVFLYLDNVWAYRLLLVFLPMLVEPTGSYIMLHTNATGVTPKDAGLLPAVWFALYPVWMILGYKTAQNLSGRNAYSWAALFLFGIGGVVLIFGLVRFPIRWANLDAFNLTLFGTAISLIGLYLATRK